MHKRSSDLEQRSRRQAEKASLDLQADRDPISLRAACEGGPYAAVGDQWAVARRGGYKPSNLRGTAAFPAPLTGSTLKDIATPAPSKNDPAKPFW